jgi:hypothetical protein
MNSDEIRVGFRLKGIRQQPYWIRSVFYGRCRIPTKSDSDPIGSTDRSGSPGEASCNQLKTENDNLRAQIATLKSKNNQLEVENLIFKIQISGLKKEVAKLKAVVSDLLKKTASEVNPSK